MLISELKLRKIVREIIEKDELLNEATTASNKTYTDTAGNKFQIRSGSLMLTARGSGKTEGLPIKIPAKTLSAAVKALSSKYPGDAALTSLVSAAPAQPASAGGSGSQVYVDDKGNKFQIRNGSLMLTARSSGKTEGLPITIPANTLAATAKVLSSRYPSDAALSTMAGKTSSSQPAGGDGSQIFPSLRRNFPLFDPAALGKNPVAVGAAGTPNCSEWVGNMLDTTIGNAWHAHNNSAFPVLKFDAYSNFSSYKSSVEKILNEMNKDRYLGPVNAEKWNDKAKPISSGLIPSAATIAAVMQLGDIVGIFHQESSHHGEALFDGATACSLARRSPPSVPPGAFVDGNKPWDYSMLGQDKKFTVSKPFGLNTHVGLVGAIHNSRPIVFHNINGTVYACYADKMTSKDFPMWVKQGKASAPSLLDNVPTAAGGLNIVTGGLKAAKKYLGL